MIKVRDEDLWVEAHTISTRFCLTQHQIYFHKYIKDFMLGIEITYLLLDSIQIIILKHTYTHNQIESFPNRGYM